MGMTAFCVASKRCGGDVCVCVCVSVCVCWGVVGKINKHIWECASGLQKGSGMTVFCKRRLCLLRRQNYLMIQLAARSGELTLMGAIIDKHFNPALKHVQGQLDPGVFCTQLPPPPPPD